MFKRLFFSLSVAAVTVNGISEQVRSWNRNMPSVAARNALKQILPLEARNGEDLNKVFTTAQGKSIERSELLRTKLIPNSISYFLATFCELEHKRRKGIISTSGIFELKAARIALEKDETTRLRLMTDKLKRDGSLCTADNIKKFVWNDEEKDTSFGNFVIETDYGVTMHCLFRGKKIDGKPVINEVYVDSFELPGKFMENHKILDVDWKLDGKTLAQKEAFEDISQLKVGDEFETVQDVFRNLGTSSGKQKTEELKRRLYTKSLTYLFLTMRNYLSEDRREVKGFSFDETNVSRSSYKIDADNGVGAGMAFKMAKMMKVGPNLKTQNLLSADNFQNLIWKKSTKKKSRGSFTLKTGFGITMDCLFEATNQNGKLRIEKVAVCNRKAPKSFAKAITLIDRTK